MDKRELVCIVCPKGCRLSVENINEEFKVSGNTCKRGEVYGINEIINPTRIITTTVKLQGSKSNRLPVKTKEPLPKELLFKAMEVINTIEVQAPVNLGDIVLNDILNTGVQLVATKTIEY
ncbi:DUF1667 domain-containing protein [Hathewaya histolytica]|uniref:DUF1667 domain-containing protein n=1 Tax=Hathewaya histolytica TaxID=1498 RepID=UPI003B6764E7